MVPVGGNEGDRLPETNADGKLADQGTRPKNAKQAPGESHAGSNEPPQDGSQAELGFLRLLATPLGCLSENHMTNFGHPDGGNWLLTSC